MNNMAESSASPPKTTRKLVVLDLDNTLCDFTYRQLLNYKPDKSGRSVRPYLQYFLKKVYFDYDIIIWSATDYEVILGKLLKMRILQSKDFKITECLDDSAMSVVETYFGSVEVKSLDVIWRKYPIYDHTNTLIIDDQYLNFLLTPNNGLQIKPYFKSMYCTDNELFKLSVYLDRLARCCTDFSQEDHSNWKTYNPEAKE